MDPGLRREDEGTFVNRNRYANFLTSSQHELYFDSIKKITFLRRPQSGRLEGRKRWSRFDGEANDKQASRAHNRGRTAGDHANRDDGPRAKAGRGSEGPSPGQSGQ